MGDLDQVKKQTTNTNDVAPSITAPPGKGTKSGGIAGGAPKQSGITGDQATDQSTDMQLQANEAEADTEKQVIAPGTVAPLNISNVSDRQSASIAMRHVQESQELLMRATSHGELNEGKDEKGQEVNAMEKYRANDKVLGLLQTYSDEANVQSVATSNFQILYARMVTDFARLNKVGTQYNGVSLNDAKDEKEAAQQANDKIAASGGGGAAAMHSQLDKIKHSNPKLAKQIETLKRNKTLLEAQEKHVLEAQGSTTSNLGHLQADLHQVRSASNFQGSVEMKAAFDKAKKEADETDKVVGGLVSALGKGVVAAIKEGPQAGAIEAAKGVGEVALDKIKDEAKKLNEHMNIEAGYFPELAKNDDVAQLQLETSARDQVMGAAGHFKTHRKDFLASLDTFVAEMKTLETTKAQYRQDVVELGHDLDAANQKMGGKKGSTPFSEMSVFLAEADTFLVQADAVFHVGKEELDASKGADANDPSGSSASSANKASKALAAVNQAGGQKWWRAYEWEQTKYKSFWSLEKETIKRVGVREDHIDIKTGANPTRVIGGKNEGEDYGSAETPMLGGNFGGNAIVGKSLQDVEKMKAKVAAFRAAIAGVVFG